MNPLSSWSNRMADTPSSWHPMMNRSNRETGLWDFTASPCKSCCHIKEPKGVCRTYQDCPIRINTILPEGHEVYTEKKPVVYKKCPVHGCKEKIPEKEKCCEKHWPRLRYRLEKGVPVSLLYVDEKLPNDWRERFGTEHHGRVEK